jgi:hypothetical protein
MDHNEDHTDAGNGTLDRMEAAKLAVAMELLSELYGMEAASDVYYRLRDFDSITIADELVKEEWPDLKAYEAAEEAKAAAIKAANKEIIAQINKHLGGAA